MKVQHAQSAVNIGGVNTSMLFEKHSVEGKARAQPGFHGRDDADSGEEQS
jgi:hypothetical protein